METRILDVNRVNQYKQALIEEEKSRATIEKYVRDVLTFAGYAGEKNICKELVISYKNYLIEKNYSLSSINSMIAALNSFFVFSEWNDCRLKYCKVQRRMFRPEEKELTREEYERLIMAAEKSGNMRLSLIIQAICSTGIRVSELKYITIESVKKGIAIVTMKGKTRNIFIPEALQKKLLKYAEERDIIRGCIFLTANGRPIDRTAVWREMKRICISADVNPEKVYPHNLRHLFARIFFSVEKDIVKLADVLGHSCIDTTRIYLITTGVECRKRIEALHLVI